MKLKCLLFLIIFSSVIGSTHAQVIDSTAQWTWMAGVSIAPDRGPVAVKLTENGTNKPATRFNSCGWADKKGNLWLFGGDYNGSNVLNDVWRYSISKNMWTWMHGTFDPGSNAGFNITANYNAKGVPGTSANHPGGRRGMTSFTDTAGKFWLFGGARNPLAPPPYDASLTFADLWKYDPDQNLWTYVSGATTTKYLGNYGTKGTGVAPPNANPTQPRSRGSAYTGGAGAAWADDAGNFWIFGGYGLNKAGTTLGYLNDLWRYNPSLDEWTWIGGSDETNQPSNYGAKGFEAPTNEPGGRYGMIYWKGKDGKFYMYGGTSVDGHQNDLWRFDPVSKRWTWLQGSDLPRQLADYGTRGVFVASNTPGGRIAAGMGDGWVDKNGKLWFFGGYGTTVVNNAASGRFEDLWCYDPALNQWAWMKGIPNRVGAAGNYPGTAGTTGPSFQPGGRDTYAKWVDTNGNFWLLGGIATSPSTTNSKGDLWRLAPVIPALPPAQPGIYTSAKPNVCNGESNVTYTVPTVTGATSYEWVYTGTGVTFSGTATTTVATNNLSFSATATSGTLRVRAVNVVGSSAYRDTAITVNSLPVVTVNSTGTRSICDGDSLGLVATATGVNYQWKNGATNVGTNSSGFQAKVTGVYTVTVTNATTNCFAISTPATTLTINPLPTVTVNKTGAQVICAGDSMELVATTATGMSYQWKNNGTTNVGTNSASYKAKTAGAYTVVVTNTTTNCSATSTPATTLTVNQLPTITVNKTGTQYVCMGDSLALIATTGTGMSFQWQNGTANVGTNSSTFYAKLAGSYTVIVTNTTTNCAATSTPATSITVSSAPVATISTTQPANICVGDSVRLTATVGTGYVYQWKDGSTPFSAVGNTYAAYATGNYSVVVTDGNSGCKDSSAAMAIMVHNRPVASLQGDTAFCEGEVTILNVIAQDNNLTYRWKRGNTTIPLAFAHFLEIEDPGVYSVVVGRSNVAGCEDTTNALKITVYPEPIVNITWDGILLHATKGYVGYLWSKSGIPIISTGDSTLQPSTKGSYVVKVTDSNGCTATSSVYNVASVGIADDFDQLMQVRVYPNPARNTINIDAAVPVNIMLISLDGKLLQQQSDAHVLNIGDYADGVYLLRITDSNGMLIRNEKIVKQN